MSKPSRSRNAPSISKPPPIKYVLYSHYNKDEADDLKVYKREKQTTNFEKLNGVVHLQRHFRGLRELLTSPGHEGVLVLFYAPDKSFDNLLLEITRGNLNPDDHRRHDKSLCFAEGVAACVERKLAEEELADRVRFLTPSDLLLIFGPVNTIFAQAFRRYFIGQAPGTRYDTPKIVEAILRLRLLGNGVPVLRLDHDVIFRFGKEDKVIGDLGLFKAVACAVQAYQLRLAQPTVSTFLFSASYNSKGLLDPRELKRGDRFEAWSRAFATRVFPALKADPKSINEICCLSKAKRGNRLKPTRLKQLQNKEWDKYVKKNLDQDFAKQFYGLKDNETKLETHPTGGLASIGAHPLYAVISGALLCLSEGAILDLPPFSNFRNNVMWIDDHLKYSLHRAMHHFTSDEPLELEEPGLSNARFDVSVTKERPSVGDLPAYILGVYLPTLLWGSIMDAWITHDSILKYRIDPLDQRHKRLWRKAKSQQDQAPLAPLPKAMLKALSSGNFSPDDEDELRDALDTSAVTRIEKVRQLWANIRSGGQETFASYWAQGRVKEVFSEECFGTRKDRLWEGIASGRPLSDSITKRRDLSNPDMSDKIRDLIEDAITYVHWTLRWPRFVQIVRSIRQGDFKGDLGWRPDRANQSNVQARGPSGM